MRAKTFRSAPNWLALTLATLCAAACDSTTGRPATNDNDAGDAVPISQRSAATTVCRDRRSERVTGKRTLDPEEHTAALARLRNATVAATPSLDYADKRRITLRVETPDGSAVYGDIDHNNPPSMLYAKNLDIA